MGTSRPSAVDVVHVSTVHPATDPRILLKECASLAESGLSVALVATGEAPTAIVPGVQVIAIPRAGRRLRRFVEGPCVPCGRCVACALASCTFTIPS